MHGESRDMFRNAGAQRDDAGDVRSVRRLADTPENNFIN